MREGRWQTKDWNVKKRSLWHEGVNCVSILPVESQQDPKPENNFHAPKSLQLKLICADGLCLTGIPDHVRQCYTGEKEERNTGNSSKHLGKRVKNNDLCERFKNLSESDNKQIWKCYPKPMKWGSQKSINASFLCLPHYSCRQTSSVAAQFSKSSVHQKLPLKRYEKGGWRGTVVFTINIPPCPSLNRCQPSPASLHWQDEKGGTRLEWQLQMQRNIEADPQTDKQTDVTICIWVTKQELYDSCICFHALSF